VDLYEFEAKRVFREAGIAVPPGVVIGSLGELEERLGELTFPVVVKPQLSQKKRGKAGAILFAGDEAELRARCAELFAREIRGERARWLLVERKVPIRREHYAAVTVDYQAGRPVMLVGAEGGVEIEELAREDPSGLSRFLVDPLSGPGEEELGRIAEVHGSGFRVVMERLYGIFTAYDAKMVEINPLVTTEEGELVAVDAVLNIDDDAAFRQPLLAEVAGNHPPPGEREARAAARRWTYIALDGEIGILSSGAGLTMAILDLIHAAGGRAANFLDTAQIDGDGMYEAFELLSGVEGVRVILVNMFAGLNRCDSLAEGIVRFLRERSPRQPVVVRMVGNREAEGHRLLRAAGIEPFREIEAAVARAVALAGGGR
jgi:succinyl-CoA synthetase beta subunit